MNTLACSLTVTRASVLGVKGHYRFRKQGKSRTGTGVVATLFQHTKKAVETAHLICSRASVSHAELQVEIPTIFECMKVPVVSMGVVRWVEHMLTDSTFFEEAAESSSLFLVLLDEATSCHSLQHPHVLELLERLIEGSYPMLEVSVQVSGGGGGFHACWRG